MGPHIFADPLRAQSLAEAGAAFFVFLLFLWIASGYLPGSMHQGATLADGARRSYRLNGLATFFAVLAVQFIGSWLGAWSLSWPVRRFPALFIVANLFAFGFSAYLYWKGRQSKPQTRPGVSCMMKDYFFGVDRNPSWRQIDLKMFSYRPSLIGLCLVNVAFAALQWERHGQFSARMVLFQLFWFIYILNHFQFERGMLSTWDIIEERFGWMLVWGDYVFVPFAYSVAGWFLVDNFEPLPVPFIVGIVALYAFGFLLFRGANGQKHAFKQNPHTLIWGKPAKSLAGQLLLSGFWGIGRKLNYSGELCLYCAWTLVAGFGSWIPWLLPIWLLGLLLHRAARDDARCRAKYGALWETYCQRVNFRMFPGLY